MKWWIIQDVEDPEPWGVIALADPGGVYRYVPNVGLVYWPSLGDYVWLGETGGHVVSQEEALALINSGWRPAVPPQEQIEVATAERPVLPVPGNDRSQVAENAPVTPPAQDDRPDSSGTPSARPDTPKRYLAVPPGELTERQALELGEQLFDAIQADRDRQAPH